MQDHSILDAMVESAFSNKKNCDEFCGGCYSCKSPQISYFYLFFCYLVYAHRLYQSWNNVCLKPLSCIERCLYLGSLLASSKILFQRQSCYCSAWDPQQSFVLVPAVCKFVYNFTALLPFLFVYCSSDLGIEVLCRLATGGDSYPLYKKCMMDFSKNCEKQIQICLWDSVELQILKTKFILGCNVSTNIEFDLEIFQVHSTLTVVHVSMCILEYFFHIFFDVILAVRNALPCVCNWGVLPM